MADRETVREAVRRLNGGREGAGLVEWVADHADELLVALAGAAGESVRLSVLTPRERAVMKLGEAYLTREKVGRSPYRVEDEFLVHKCRQALDSAYAEARALTPEGKDG